MIENIRFENYKAFKEGELVLSPITILLGPNSCGKSSLLQLFLLFSQSQMRISSGPEFSPLQLNGERTSFGDTLNIVQNRDIKKLLKFKFKIPAFDVFDADFMRMVVDVVIYKYSDFVRSDKVANSLSKDIIDMYRSFMKGSDALSSKEVQELIGHLIPFVEQMKVDSQKKRESLVDTMKRPGGAKEFQAIVKGTESLLGRDAVHSQMLDLLKIIRNEKSWRKINCVQYSFHYSKTSEHLEIESISLMDDADIILSYSSRHPNGRRGHNLKSQIFDNKVLAKYKSDFVRDMKMKGLETYFPTTSHIMRSIQDSPLISCVTRLFNRATVEVSSEFYSGKIKHVSPLRAFPQRYYLTERLYTKSTLDTRDGASLADTLKQNPTVRSHVNKWLKLFGLSVDVHDIRDIIHSIKVSQNGLDLDLTDVGFGISQVLPVVVQGFLADKESVILVEQPEIHLHPRMQAELADLLIDITKTTGCRLVVETHSEYLLKRLRRRIAEYTSKNKKERVGSISSEKVAIYLVEGADGKEKYSRVERIHIEKSGAFKWPKDFLAVELDDTLAFARLQVPNDGSESQELKDVDASEKSDQ